MCKALEGVSSRDLANYLFYLVKNVTYDIPIILAIAKLLDLVKLECYSYLSWPTKDTAVYVTSEGQKLRGQLFKRSKRGLYDVLLGFVYKCFNYFSFSNTMSTHFQDNIKNILMLKILK